MLNEGEIKEIINFTKTPTWKLFKKLFQEKKDGVLEYMESLDIDNEKQRKDFKNMKANLSAFKSLISEIENLEIEEKNIKQIEEYNNNIDNFLNADDKEFDK